MLLNTKIQHQNFEPGEFVDIQLRTYEETINCINTFPWEGEREHLRVSLTNPSVTIEKPLNNFLKFALFYNGKFVLHYFNDQHELFTKSFFQKEEAFPFIKNCFDSEVFDVSEFKKEPTFMQHNLVHFVTQDFHYTITPKRVKDYLLNTSGILFAIFAIFLFIILFTGKGALSGAGLAFLIFIYFLFFGGGLNLLVFWNYWRYAKNKILIMSKGDDVFYFGDQQHPKKYDKKDILRVIFYHPNAYRNPLNSFAVVKIEFRDNESIQIPNLFVSEYALQDKLFNCPQVVKSKLKLIKKNG